MAAVGEWLGGKPPGGVNPYSYKERQVGWRFEIGGDSAEAEKLPRDVPRCKSFSFKVYGEGAEAEAKDYQRQVVADHGLELKNQYHYREDPNDGLPYIEFHIRDTAGEDYFPMCDVGDLPLLEEHTWHVRKNGENIYVATRVRIDGKWTIKQFHSFKCPDWPIVDHYSEIQKENRNGLDNRSKHLRDGSGGSNQENCRLQKNNTSGSTGVGYHITNKAWYGLIIHNGERKWSPPYRGPEDKAHPSYLAAREWRRAQAATVGNTNGQ